MTGEKMKNFERNEPNQTESNKEPNIIKDTDTRGGHGNDNSAAKKFWPRGVSSTEAIPGIQSTIHINTNPTVSQCHWNITPVLVHFSIRTYMHGIPTHPVEREKG